MARKKEHPYDRAVHRADRRPKPPRRRAGPPRKVVPLPETPPPIEARPGFAELAALIGPAFRDELSTKLGDIAPAAILEILAPLPKEQQAVRAVADLYRKEHDEKVRGSQAWRRERVRDTFKRFDKAVEEFYECYEGAAPYSPVNPARYPVLRLMREIRDYLASDARDDLIAWMFTSRSGPVTVYVTNDGLTQDAAVRHLLKARFRMGRSQQDWWLRAVRGQCVPGCENLRPRTSP